MTKRCKVAFVGAGYMSSEHMRAFHDLPHVELVGISSRNRARAEALAANYPGVHVYATIAELYDATLADVVVVSVNELSTNEVARRCFAFPWIVVLEKPAGYNLKDAEDIVAQSAKRTAPVFVGLNRRTYSSTRTALAELDRMSGQRFIKVQDQEDMRVALYVDKKPKTVVDNWMYANSLHLIDYFRIFGRGDIVSVETVVPWTPQLPSIVASHIRFSSGDIGLYEAVWNGPAPWVVTVCTPEDRLELRPIEHLGIQRNGQRQTVPMVLDEIDQQFKPGLRYQAQQIVRAARKESFDHIVTLQDSLKSMKLVAQIYQLDS